MAFADNVFADVFAQLQQIYSYSWTWQPPWLSWRQLWVWVSDTSGYKSSTHSTRRYAVVVVTIQVILKMAAETNQRALQIAVCLLHITIQAMTRIGSRHTQIHSVPNIMVSSTPVLLSARSFSMSYLRWQTQYQKAKRNPMLNRWTSIHGTVKLECSPMRQPTTTISLTPMGRYPSLMT
jgi:hypothetical protein